MHKDQLAKLKEAFEVSIKPGRGQYRFVKTADILDRMNETFDGRWCTDVIKVEKIGDEVLAQVLISIVDDKGKSLVWQAGFGSAKVFNGVEIGNLYKSAVSKAQKSALRNWGVALHLEGDVSGGDYSNQNSSGPGVNIPPATGGFMPQGTTTSAPPPSTPAPQEAGAVNVPGMPPASTVPGRTDSQVPTTTNVPQSEPVATPPVNNGTPFTPPTNGLPPTGTTTAPTTPAPTPTGLPPMQQVPNNTVTTPQAPAPMGAPEGSELTGITMIQKLAIQAKLDTKKTSFKDFVSEAFADQGLDVTNLPESIDDLSYQDAMVLASRK